MYAPIMLVAALDSYARPARCLGVALPRWVRASLDASSHLTWLFKPSKHPIQNRPRSRFRKPLDNDARGKLRSSSHVLWLFLLSGPRQSDGIQRTRWNSDEAQCTWFDRRQSSIQIGELCVVQFSLWSQVQR